MLAEVRALGFKYAELGHATRVSLLDGAQKAVATGEMTIASLHNFCPLPLGVNGPAPDYYLPSSDREHERANAVRHTLRTIECAATLGAKVVVLHCGLVPLRTGTMKLLERYVKCGPESPRFLRLRERVLAARAKRRRPYVDHVLRVFEEIVPRAKERGVKLALETRFGIEEIPDADETAEMIENFGADVIGYWHDVGHAQVKEQLGLGTHESLLERFRGRTLGMHLQDFAPPVHDHLPPGRGEFNFARLTPFVTGDMVLAWEIHHEWAAEQMADGLRRTHELLRPEVKA